MVVEQAVRPNLFYIENWSLKLDIRIALLTGKALLVGWRKNEIESTFDEY